MAITNLETGETSHEGRVVAARTNHSVRIMSDVWADLHYVLVYEPTREATGVSSTNYKDEPMGACGTIRRIQVSNSEFPHGTGKGFKYEVDASEEAQAAFEGWERGGKLDNDLRNYSADQFRAAERRRTIEKGASVRVTKGRKVPKGTEGVVFWIGNSGYGTKVGLGLPNEDGSFDYVEKSGRYGKTFKSYKNVAWTAISNVERTSELGGRIL